MSWSVERGFVRYLNQRESERIERIQQRLAREYAQHGDWSFAREAAGSRMWMSLSTHGEAALYDANQNAIVDPGDLGTELVRIPIVVQGDAVGWLLVAPQSRDQTLEAQFLRGQSIALVSVVGVALALMTLASVLLTRDMLSRIQSLVAVTRSLTGGNLETRVADAHSSDELAMLGRHINTLAHTLAENKQTRQRHIADISHELRTPLAVLRGEIEAAQDGVRPLNARTLGSFHDETMRLTRLVEDLYQLSLADIGQLQYTMQEVELRPLLEDVAELFTARLEDHQLEWGLDWDAPPEICVEGDPDKLKQLWTNLIENSCRYTDAGGALKLSAAMSDPTTLHLTLDDTAPGVPPDALTRLFERLYRVDKARTRAKGGSGLGLAICERIVEAHQGHITAEASPLGGLRVTVSLPVITGS